MTDHQLSTRDLADSSATDGAAGSPETPQPTDDALTRDQAEEQVTATGAADTELGDTGLQETHNADTEHEPLFPTDQSDRFTDRWQEIQTSFVDQPREAVAEADSLVADLMQRLAATFSQERERLEAQWDRGDDVSTEDLRVALTRYRSFFDRLLSA